MHEKTANSSVPYGKINPFHDFDPQRRIAQSRVPAKSGIKTPQEDVKLISERLMAFLTFLDQDVEIMIRPRPPASGTGHISVLAGQ